MLSSHRILFLPETKLAACNTGIHALESVITDGAPDSVVSDLQTTFTLCCTADKSQIYSMSLRNDTSSSATVNDTAIRPIMSPC